MVAKAFAYAAGLGVVLVLLAEAVGITNFGAGFCCGYERDILSTYALMVWFGILAACVAPLIAAGRDPGVPLAERAKTALSGGVGALIGLPAVALMANRTPPGSDGGVGPAMMMQAYGIGVAFGVIVALVIELSGAYRTFVRGGLLITSGVLWLADVALAIGRNPFRISPGGIGLGRIPISLGILPYLISTLLWGFLAGAVALRLRGRNWRTGETWLVGLAAVVMLALVIRLTIYLSDHAAPPLSRLGFIDAAVLSSGLLYAAVGVGVVLGFRHCMDRPVWLALAAAAGFVLVAAALRLAIAFGPDLSGDGALSADWYDIGFGLVAALLGGAAVGFARRRPAPATPVPNSA